MKYPTFKEEFEIARRTTSTQKDEVQAIRVYYLSEVHRVREDCENILNGRPCSRCGSTARQRNERRVH